MKQCAWFDSYRVTVSDVQVFSVAQEENEAQAAREIDLSFNALSEPVNATIKTLQCDQVSGV